MISSVWGDVTPSEATRSGDLKLSIHCAYGSILTPAFSHSGSSAGALTTVAFASDIRDGEGNRDGLSGTRSEQLFESFIDRSGRQNR